MIKNKRKSEKKKESGIYCESIVSQTAGSIT